MSKKALVLSSGGVDSTTCVSVAVHELGRENVATVSIFYGQKHRKELDAAQKVADFYHVPHYELDLSKIFQYSNCSLLPHHRRGRQGKYPHRPFQKDSWQGLQRHLASAHYGTAHRSIPCLPHFGQSGPHNFRG